MQRKILVVDDEAGIVELLRDNFEFQDYIVYTAANGMQAMEQISKNPDIILLDVNMPGLDGFDVCKRIRAHVDCPILFLTAKTTEQDRVNGLMLGGDDYILKPFGMDELNARVEAHLRREERKNQKGSIKYCKDLLISYSERCVYCDGRDIGLTKTEFDIVELLSMYQAQVFGKERVYETVRGYDGDGDSSIITEHIRRIRAKIARYSDASYIETVWGVGYKWIG